MKHHTALLLPLFALLTACNQTLSPELPNDYFYNKIVEARVDSAIDINNDGVAHSDLLQEFHATIFNGSAISFGIWGETGQDMISFNIPIVSGTDTTRRVFYHMHTCAVLYESDEQSGQTTILERVGMGDFSGTELEKRFVQLLDFTREGEQASITLLQNFLFWNDEEQAFEYRPIKVYYTYVYQQR